MASSRIIFAFASLLGMMSGATHSAMLPISQAVFGSAYDDNVNNAGEPDQRIGSQRWSLSWQRRDALWRGIRIGLDSAFEIRAQHVAREDQLSNLQLALATEFWWVTGTSFHAPSLRARLQLAQQDFDSRLRDHRRYQLKLMLAQRLSTELTAQTHLVFSRGWAEAQEFSGHMMNVGAGLRWRVSPGFGVFVLAEKLRQDVASSVDAMDSALTGSALPWVEDDAIAGNWVYRLDSDGTHLSLGGGGPLVSHLQWNVRLDQFDLSARYPLAARARYAGEYRRRVASFNIIWTFQ